MLKIVARLYKERKGLKEFVDATALCSSEKEVEKAIRYLGGDDGLSTSERIVVFDAVSSIQYKVCKPKITFVDLKKKK